MQKNQNGKIARTIAQCSIWLTLGVTSACTVMSPENKQPLRAAYDFGLATETSNSVPKISYPVVINNVEAPAWLNRADILYRLAYDNSNQIQPYANSRWIASPTALITSRMQQALAIAIPLEQQLNPQQRPYELTVKLEEFSQIFDTPQTSYGLLRATAVLKNDIRSSQQTFLIKEQAVTPDVEGGVKALTKTTDQFIVSLIKWLSEK